MAPRRFPDKPQAAGLLSGTTLAATLWRVELGCSSELWSTAGMNAHFTPLAAWHQARSGQPGRVRDSPAAAGRGVVGWTAAVAHAATGSGQGPPATGRPQLPLTLVKLPVPRLLARGQPERASARPAASKQQPKTERAELRRGRRRPNLKPANATDWELPIHWQPYSLSDQAGLGTPSEPAAAGDSKRRHGAMLRVCIMHVILCRSVEICHSWIYSHDSQRLSLRLESPWLKGRFRAQPRA